MTWIEVHRLNPPATEMRTWRFDLFVGETPPKPGFEAMIRIVLNEYCLSTRKTRRHKWQVEKAYRRLGPSDLKYSDVVIPDDVKQEVIALIGFEFTENVRD